jgi:hypothetical protein
MVPSMVASGALPVAVNVADDPASPAAVAVRVLGPAVGPNVQLVTAAMPSPLVFMAVGGSTVPPPAVTWKVTGTPLTGLLSPSVTLTDGAMATALPARAFC